MFFDLYKYFARYKKVGTGISFQTLNYSLHFLLLSYLENNKLAMQLIKDCMSPIFGKGPTNAPTKGKIIFENPRESGTL